MKNEKLRVVSEEELQEMIKLYFTERVYRPTAVGMLYRDRKLLLVNSARGDSWAFPQGGIPRGRTMFDSLGEELWEELGIDIGRDPSNLKDVSSFSNTFFIEELIHPNTRTSGLPKGNAQGKAYFAAAARYVGDPSQVVLNKEEVKAYDLFDLRTAEKYIKSHNSPDKVRITLEIIGIFKDRLESDL
ncbi:MAG: NUDIX domain-containing protein [archaeon]